MRLALALLAMTAPALADAPARVLSMNLCTDQLAMMIAAPGQLVSVSYLARDPAYSAMADEAAAFPPNRGLAEDILRLRPDLVLASEYSSADTLAMLRRLDLPVEVIPFAADMAGIRDAVARTGQAMGREDRAAEIIARFDADLAALRALPPVDRRAALYEASGYSAGPSSLSGAILAEAGMGNVAGDLGLTFGGFLPLERLVMADPDVVIASRPLPGASRAEEVLTHPALRALTAAPGTRIASGSDWICGTPHVLRAIAGLRAGP